MSFIALAPSRALALPVFAHRYGFSCTQCHTIVPQLNSFGEAFRANGFRLPFPQRGTMPIAVKVNLQATSAQQAGLPKAVVDEIELLSGGAVGKRSSYFVEQYAVDGGMPGRTRDAWIQTALGHGPVAQSPTIRVGQFTLPLPVDPETERPTQSHYAIYDQTVGTNPFALFDPRIGVDATLFANGTRADLCLLEAYDRGSGLPSSGVDAMLALGQDVAAGRATLYRYQGNRTLPTGRDVFSRTGIGWSTNEGRLSIDAVLQTGSDANASGLRLSSNGGFAQFGFAPRNDVAVYYRYDRAFDGTAVSQGSTFSLVTRPARNYRFTVEATAAPGGGALSTALLFAY